MGRFLSDFPVSVCSDSLFRSCCQNCPYRDACPYVCNQTLYRAAFQGRAAAELLTREADRLLERISRAEDVSCLLNGDRALERALSHALRSELALMNDLRAQAPQHCP